MRPFCRIVVSFSLLVSLLMLTPFHASASLGFFNHPSLGTGKYVRTVPSFASPFAETRQGRVEVGIRAQWLNTWAHNVETSKPPYDWENPEDTRDLKHGTFLIDSESLILTPSILLRVSEYFTFDVTLPMTIQGGGVMDGFIEGFHSLVDVGQHNRDDWPRGRSNFIYVDKNDNVVDKSDQLKRFSTGDVQLAASMLVSWWPMITARAIVKLPTSRIYDDQENSGTDVTGQLIWSWQWWRLVGNHGVGATFYTREGDDHINPKRIRYATLNSLEYMVDEGFSWLVTVNTASEAAEYPELNKPVVELTMGVKRVWGPGVFEFGLIENLFFFDNSPDFGIHMGYTFKGF